MSVEDKVKSIIVEQLGVDANEVTRKLPSLMTSAQILWTPWNS